MNTYTIKIMSFGILVLEFTFNSRADWETIYNLETVINRSNTFRCHVWQVPNDL